MPWSASCLSVSWLSVCCSSSLFPWLFSVFLHSLYLIPPPWHIIFCPAVSHAVWLHLHFSLTLPSSSWVSQCVSLLLGICRTSGHPPSFPSIPSIDLSQPCVWLNLCVVPLWECMCMVWVCLLCMHLFVCVLCNHRCLYLMLYVFLWETQWLCACVGGLALGVTFIVLGAPSLSLSQCHLLVCGTPVLCRAWHWRLSTKGRAERG